MEEKPKDYKKGDYSDRLTGYPLEIIQEKMDSIIFIAKHFEPVQAKRMIELELRLYFHFGYSQAQHEELMEQLQNAKEYIHTN